MRFTKMEGLGNDYIYINCMEGEPEDLPALAVRLSGEMGKYRLSAVAESLGGFIRQCNYNVGVGQLLGALAVELIR